MTALTLDHLDLISRAHDSLQALAGFVSDNDDETANGLAWILIRIADDLDRVNTEASTARQADHSATETNA